MGAAWLHVVLDAPAEAVAVRVYDLAGRLVRTDAAGPLGAGAHRVPLGLAGLAGGVYAVAVEAGGERATARLTVLR